MITELSDLRKKLTEAERERDFNEGIYKTVAGERSTLKSEVEANNKRISQLSDELKNCRTAIRGAEAQRDRARAQAEAMRFQAFPIPPTFEWERPRTAEELNQFDPVSFARR